MGEKKSAFRIGVSVILLMLLACISGAVVYYVSQMAKQRQEEEIWREKLESVKISNPDMPEAYRAAAALNPEVYAWMEIPGTEISYPVVQREDNGNWYLDHGADGNASEAGAIFTQTYNSRDFSDPDTVLYGNRMEDGSMFGSLLEYEDPAYFDEHRNIRVYLPDRTLEYRIAATYTGDDSHLLLTRDLSDPGNFQKHIGEIMEQRGLRTNVDTDMVITVEDRLLTLSTGHPSSPEARFLVRAVLIE